MTLSGVHDFVIITQAPETKNLSQAQYLSLTF